LIEGKPKLTFVLDKKNSIR